MDPLTLGVVALFLGATGSYFSGLFQNYEKDKALKREEDRVTQERDDKLKLLDLKFEEAKDAANKSADRSDIMSDMNENTVSNQTNNAIEQLSLQEVADAYNFNYMAEQNAANTGNALASQAASGTRSSSINDAVEMQAAQNAQNLQNTENQQRAAYDSNLNGILSSLAQNQFQIQNNRTDAIDLRNSYAEGGSQYKQYQLTRGLQEQAYNNRLQDIALEKEDNSGFKGWLKTLGNAFGVNASQSFQFGKDVADFMSPTYSKTTNYSFDNVAPGSWQSNSLSYLNYLK